MVEEAIREEPIYFTYSRQGIKGRLIKCNGIPVHNLNCFLTTDSWQNSQWSIQFQSTNLFIPPPKGNK